MRGSPLKYVNECPIAVFLLASTAYPLSCGVDCHYDVTLEIDGDQSAS